MWIVFKSYEVLFVCLGVGYQGGILKGLDCLPASSSLVATSRVLCISQSTLRTSERQPHFRFLLLGEVLLGCTKYQKPTQTKQNSCGGNLERVSLPLCWGFHPWRVRWGGMGSFLSGHGTSGKKHDVPSCTNTHTDEGYHLHILPLEVSGRLLGCFSKCSNATSRSSVSWQRLPEFSPQARIYAAFWIVSFLTPSPCAGSEHGYLLHSCWPQHLRELRFLNSRTQVGSSSLGNHSFAFCLVLPPTWRCGVFNFNLFF